MTGGREWDNSCLCGFLYHIWLLPQQSYFSDANIKGKFSKNLTGMVKLLSKCLRKIPFKEVSGEDAKSPSYRLTKATGQDTELSTVVLDLRKLSYTILESLKMKNVEMQKLLN